MEVEELEVPTYSEDEAAFIASLESDSATFTDDATEAASNARYARRNSHRFDAAKRRSKLSPNKWLTLLSLGRC
ncbi:hypothetical protein O9992_19320 [Vibrio lentus]|nr:hypothetical protein [Vibrio lentus]